MPGKAIGGFLNFAVLKSICAAFSKFKSALLPINFIPDLEF